LRPKARERKEKAKARARARAHSSEAAKDVICHNCGKKVHYAKDCWSGKGAKTTSTATSDSVCNHCGKKGHFAKDCWSKAAAGKGKKGKSKGKSTNALEDAKPKPPEEIGSFDVLGF
jgi:hypothetical protein